MRVAFSGAFILLAAVVMPVRAAVCNPVVVIETNLGTMAVELYPDKAPITVDNFLRYVNTGFYDGLVFHRVIKNFMIQGGSYYLDGYTIYPVSPELQCRL